MRHIKNFNENVGNGNLFDRTQRDISKEETSTTDPTIEQTIKELDQLSNKMKNLIKMNDILIKKLQQSNESS